MPIELKVGTKLWVTGFGEEEWESQITIVGDFPPDGDTEQSIQDQYYAQFDRVTFLPNPSTVAEWGEECFHENRMHVQDWADEWAIRSYLASLPHLRAHMTCESCSAQDAEAIRKVLDEEAARDAAKSAVENWTRSIGDNWDDLWAKYQALHDACKVAHTDYELRLSAARDAVVEAARSCKAQLPTQVAYAVDALELIEAEGSGGEVG